MLYRRSKKLNNRNRQGAVAAAWAVEDENAPRLFKLLPGASSNVLNAQHLNAKVQCQLLLEIKPK